MPCEIVAGACVDCARETTSVETRERLGGGEKREEQNDKVQDRGGECLGARHGLTLRFSAARVSSG